MDDVLAGIILPEAGALRAALGARGFAGGDASAEVRWRVVTRGVWPGERLGGVEARACVQAWCGLGVYGFGAERGEAQGSVVAALADGGALDWRRAADRMGAAMPRLPEPRGERASPEAAALLARAMDAARAVADVRRVEVVLEESAAARRVAPWSAGGALAPATRREKHAALVVAVTLAGEAYGRARAVAGEAWEIGAEALARESVRRAKHTASSQVPAPSSYAAVLRPEAAAMWAHEAFGHRLEVGAPGALRLGDSVAPGLILRHRAPHPDDEAAPPRPAILAENGRAVALLATARDAFATPAAVLVRSAYREDVRYPPLARQHTLTLEATAPDSRLAEECGGLTRGLVVQHAAHGMIADGLVTLEDAAGWRIEHGAQAQRFAGATLRLRADAVPEAFGEDAPRAPFSGTCVKHGQRAHVRTSAPSVRLRAEVA